MSCHVCIIYRTVLPTTSSSVGSPQIVGPAGVCKIFVKSDIDYITVSHWKLLAGGMTHSEVMLPFPFHDFVPYSVPSFSGR